MSVSDLPPVGIFDSGLGGLSIWLECRKLMPGRQLIYVADSANCPYGNRSSDEIIRLSHRISSFLVEKGCCMIIVACNTATTAAIAYLRDRYSIPFVGIEPAVKPAAQLSQSGTIGVLATRGTITSECYNTTKEKYAGGVEVIARAGEGLVEAVENNTVDSEATRLLLKKYIQPMIAEGADQLVLGCTHYPFLIEQIKMIAGSEINVINPAPAIARRALDVLGSNGVKGAANIQEDLFYTTGSIEIMVNFLMEISPYKHRVLKFPEYIQDQ